jgi:hypothetical protein
MCSSASRSLFFCKRRQRLKDLCAIGRVPTRLGALGCPSQLQRRVELKTGLHEAHPAAVSPDGPTPGGEAEHVVLIVGYSIESNRFYLLVNDPWPFDSFPTMPNPYLAAGGKSTDQGKYKIQISQFTSKLRWTRALWNIHK